MTSNQPPTSAISRRSIPRMRDHYEGAIASREPGIEMTPAAAFAPSKSPEGASAQTEKNSVRAHVLRSATNPDIARRSRHPQTFTTARLRKALTFDAVGRFGGHHTHPYVSGSDTKNLVWDHEGCACKAALIKMIET